MDFKERSLRFRAFDEATGRMLTTGFHIFGEATCFGIVEMILMKQPLDRTTLERMGDVITTQWTGFVDVNKKDIYEGDIVKFGESLTKDLLGVIEFRYDGFKIKYSKHQSHILSKYMWGKLKVVGNVFENPTMINL